VPLHKDDRLGGKSIGKYSSGSRAELRKTVEFLQKLLSMHRSIFARQRKYCRIMPSDFLTLSFDKMLPMLL
jgi:DNA-binding SARP family transcriptional activator